MRFELKVVIGFLVTLSLVIVLGIYSYENNKHQLEASHWVSHTHEVLYHSEQLLSTVMDIETGQRGYCLTGKEDFLAPYYKGKKSIDSQIYLLYTQTRDNPSQYHRIQQLERLIRQKVDFSTQVVEARKINELQSLSMIHSMEGKELMDDIRQLFVQLLAEEKALLKQRTQENETQVTKFNAVFITALSVTILILLILFYTIYINLRARKKAEQELQAAAKDIQDLYDNAPCGYHSLDGNGIFIQINNTMLQWLGYTKEEIIGKKKLSDIITPESITVFQTHFPVFKKQGFVQNLEFTLVRKNGTTFPGIISSSAILDANGNYVKSRSTTFDYTEQKTTSEKINALNQELEAFTYTVSHDLRSPLRSITGYTRILEEDYLHLLDEEGKRVTQVIIKSTNRMGQLIDDLLSFSQIGRKELSRHHIDMNALVRLLVKEFSEQERQHALEINLFPLEPCEGDFSMMRQVWVNLISNAIKYSQKKESIQLKIGSYPEIHSKVYYIKDNGAGFDMQYVHKLFGVFQRLHRINEFEGTGVGLAIVKRIITRHGGRVWAEGQLDQGATFYFSIPN